MPLLSTRYPLVKTHPQASPLFKRKVVSTLHTFPFRVELFSEFLAVRVLVVAVGLSNKFRLILPASDAAAAVLVGSAFLEWLPLPLACRGAIVFG